MPLSRWTTPLPWGRYSKKLVQRLDSLRSCGFISSEEALARDMRLVVGHAGSLQDGNVVALYWLVDRDDGIITEAKYQVFGQTALLAAAEIACELLVGKNYDQARRIQADLIDRHVRDKSDVAAFPKETFILTNMVIDAIDEAAAQCSDLPLPQAYVAMPAPSHIVTGDGYPGWDDLTLKQQLGIVQEVLDQHIRPYIALDDGGVEVIKLVEGRKVFIAYQGSCTSCYSSVGSTLSYIQQVMRARVHPDIEVIPE